LTAAATVAERSVPNWAKLRDVPRPRAFDQTDVTRRACEAFRDHGYTATSIEQLTVATGLRRSSLYGAFGDKHGLFLAALDLYCDENVAAALAGLAGDDAGAWRRLRRHLRDQGNDPAAVRRGCLLAKATAELAGEDPEVAKRCAAAYDSYERALADCFSRAQVAGDARAGLDPADAGALLLATLRGIESLGRAGRSRRALRLIADASVASLAA
jgi:TetR/AcrR family transcriptional repressor of nem operon